MARMKLMWRLYCAIPVYVASGVCKLGSKAIELACRLRFRTRTSSICDAILPRGRWGRDDDEPFPDS